MTSYVEIEKDYCLYPKRYRHTKAAKRFYIQKLRNNEIHIYDIIAQPMKNRKVGWNIRGEGNLAKILTIEVNPS